MRAETRIYLMDIRGSDEQERLWLSQAGERLSPQRVKKIEALKCHEDRLRSFGAGILLNLGLEQMGLSERKLRVAYGENGKPYFPDMPQLFFNLSHSGDLVMAAFSNQPVGCDVERLRPADQGLGVARHFFCPQETALLEQETSQQRRSELFCRLWTLKESVMKVTGEGMRLSLSGFCLHLEGQVQAWSEGKRLPFSFCEFSVPGYRAAVCLDGEGGAVFFSFQNLRDVI